MVHSLIQIKDVFAKYLEPMLAMIDSPKPDSSRNMNSAIVMIDYGDVETVRRY